MGSNYVLQKQIHWIHLNPGPFDGNFQAPCWPFFRRWLAPSPDTDYRQLGSTRILENLFSSLLVVKCSWTQKFQKKQNSAMRHDFWRLSAPSRKDRDSQLFSIPRLWGCLRETADEHVQIRQARWEQLANICQPNGLVISVRIDCFGENSGNIYFIQFSYEIIRAFMPFMLRIAV